MYCFAKVWRLRSSFGVSALNVLFALIGHGCAMITAVIGYYAEFECCFNGASLPQCVALNLPTMQVILPFVCSMFMTPVFCYYTKAVPPLLTVGRAAFVKHWSWAAFYATLLFMLAASLTPLLLFYGSSVDVSAILAYRDVLGIVAAVFACLQYLPQIALTLR
jgi:hypothetical protein